MGLDTVIRHGRGERSSGVSVGALGGSCAQASLNASEPEFLGSIDVPPEGAVIEGDLIVVRGWAFIRARPAARIEVTLNGTAAGRARLRIPRPDVALGDARVGLVSGFEFAGSLTADMRGTIDIAVRVVAFDGVARLLPPRRVVRIAKRLTARDVERIVTLRHRNVQCVRAAVVQPRRDRFHLLVFTHDLGIGGGQLYLSELLRRLGPHGVRCTVVSPRDGVLRPVMERQGVDVVVTGRGLPTDPITYEGYIRELSHVIVGSSADVVMLNTLEAWPGGDAAQRLGIPSVWAIHESFGVGHWLTGAYGHDQWHPYLENRLAATLAGVDRLIFEAQATSNMFARYADASRRLVVRYGVDTAGISAYAVEHDRVGARASRGVPKSAVVLLSVGVVDHRKCAACLIEAFSNAAASYPDAMLVIIGDWTCPYSEILHALIVRANLGSRLQLLPVSGEIYDWYALSDVFVMASDIESLPRSMLEAMAFGLPTLSTDVFGIPEVIEPGRNGWLFAAGDMLALQKALEDVLALPEEARRAVGRAAMDTAMREFDAVGYRDAYLRLFEDLSGKRLQHVPKAGSTDGPPG